VPSAQLRIIHSRTVIQPAQPELVLLLFSIVRKFMLRVPAGIVADARQFQAPGS
jgi:hypothetical protein